MLSNQILHKTVQDIKVISGLECAVWDICGVCHVMTSEKMMSFEKEVNDFRVSAEAIPYRIINNIGLFWVNDDDEPTYILGLHGEESQMKAIGLLSVSQLENLLFAYKERMDRNRFVQNLLMDNLLLVDVYNQAKKMKIPVEQRRTVFLIEPKSDNDSLILETLKGLYATGTRDFVTAIDEKNVILVKALEKTEDYPELEKIADTIFDTLSMEAMVSVRISYGTIVGELRDVSKSYKEAGMALEVGKVFYSDKNILAYNELGIGRLIHQLPSSLCEMFLKEVFPGEVSEIFEEEELATVICFFDNNLNISETARKLYVHRNTLMYRLEKIQKKTGLDVRIFEDALTFKIAMMVASHMKYMKS